MPVIEIISAAVGALFAGGRFFMLRGGARKNKKAGAKDPKGAKKKKDDAAARKAEAARQAPLSRDEAGKYNLTFKAGWSWQRERAGGPLMVDKHGRACLVGDINKVGMGHSGLTHRRVLGAFYANEMDDPTKGVKATEDAFRHHVYMGSASTGDKGKCPICAPGKGKQAPPLAAPTPAAKKSSVPASAG